LVAFFGASGVTATVLGVGLVIGGADGALILVDWSDFFEQLTAMNSTTVITIPAQIAGR
jgi:hypothetical protein